MITLQHLEITNFKSIRSLTLAFPPRGAILVEGRNESGKSTLFESIYFGLYGAAIVTEENRGSLEGLITYGEPSARVCLALHTTQHRLFIERSLRRGRSSVATLVVTGREDGAEERVTGVRAVNARIIAELGGLDGTALLNSCFVEQKKLSKLEDLDARERRDALLRILNLEKLSQLEDAYKLRPADEQRLQRARDRLRLAQLWGEAAALRERVARERRLRHERGLLARQAALEESRQRLLDAKHRVEHLQRLQDRETDTKLRTSHEEYMSTRDESRTLRSRRPPVVLGGMALFSALLLAGLIALGGGATAIAGLLLTGAAVAAAGTAFLYYALSSRARDAERAARASGGKVAAQRDQILQLRKSLGLADGEATAQLLARAQRDLGAAEAAVEVVEMGGHVPSLDSQPDGTSSEEAHLRESEAEMRHLSRLLGVDGEGLDVRQCEREYEEAVWDCEIKRKATTIVLEARRRVVARVLPETERNLKLLLPTLTAGRYHDARITDDYRLSVWDSDAGRHVAKNVFSGGTQDQFSLALRLAFAIAALPQELGSSPGFLFMDEPLSSFDDERTRALVELATCGELAALFPQICVISHSRSFDASLFPYVVHMEGGRIGYTNIPVKG